MLEQATFNCFYSLFKKLYNVYSKPNISPSKEPNFFTLQWFTQAQKKLFLKKDVGHMTKSKSINKPVCSMSFAFPFIALVEEFFLYLFHLLCNKEEIGFP